MKRIIATKNSDEMPSLRRTISMPYFSTKTELKEFIDQLDFVQCVEDEENGNMKVWVDICTENQDPLFVCGKKGTSNAWSISTIEKYLKEGVFIQHSFIKEIYTYVDSYVKQDGKTFKCYIVRFK